MLRRPFRWESAVAALCALAAALLGAANAWGQEPGSSTPDEEGELLPPLVKFDFKFDPVPASLVGNDPAAKRLLADLRRTVGDILKGNDPLQGPNKGTFDNYFIKYMFARMTGPDDVPYLPERRKELLKQFSYAKSQEIRDYVNQLTLKEMLRIAADNYHPAARYNALLIVGELNDADATMVGLERSAPDPMRNALTALMAELAKPALPDGMKVAVLIGIQRHIELDALRPRERRISEPGRNLLIDRLLEVAMSPVPTDTKSRFANGKFWVKRQAIMMLGILGSVGPEGKVLAALESVVGDGNAPVSLRCAAANALGQLTIPAGQSVDVKALAGKIASIAPLACRDELTRLKEREELEKARLDKLGLGPGGEGVGRGPGIPPGIRPGFAPPALPGVGGPAVVQEDPTVLTRRRLRTDLYSVYVGLEGYADGKGVKSLAKSPDDQAAVKKMADSIHSMLYTLEGTDTDLAALRLDILNKTATLEVLLQSLKPAAPPPVAPPVAPIGPPGLP